MYVPLENPDIVVLVTNSNVKHALTGSEYPQRRAACEKVASLLGVPLLRDTSMQKLLEAKDQIFALENGEEIFRRARHFLTEERRTEQLAAAMMERNWKTVGLQMYAGHQSLRDDYEVSCPELDILVGIAHSIGIMNGMIGARMTGGGFGGCMVSLVYKEKLDAICERIEREYKERTGIEPALFATRPAGGAQVVPVP